MWAKEIDTLYSEMVEQLQEINGSARSSIVNLGASLSIMKDTMRSLKAHIQIQSFLNEEQEITFFKYIKPRFAALQTYYIELHNILSSTPIGTDQMIRDYYIYELGVIDRFFKINAFYYQYYIKDENSKDNIYFLRKNRSQFLPGGELLPTETDFSTELDYLFSKFRAYEMLRDFLIKRINFLYQESARSVITDLSEKRKRSWSGDKVELVEIAYGIYYTQRLNNGKAEISEIIEWLEESLHVDLSQAYRMFVDIRRRKTISYTKFLDEMRAAIYKQIEDSFKT
jgi:hypothetical protein